MEIGKEIFIRVAAAVITFMLILILLEYIKRKKCAPHDTQVVKDPLNNPVQTVEDTAAQAVSNIGTFTFQTGFIS